MLLQNMFCFAELGIITKYVILNNIISKTKSCIQFEKYTAIVTYMKLKMIDKLLISTEWKRNKLGIQYYFVEIYTFK